MTRGEKTKNTLLGMTKGGLSGALTGLFAGGPIGALAGGIGGLTLGGLSTHGRGLSDQAIAKKQRKVAQLESMGDLSNRQSKRLDKYRTALSGQEQSFPNSTLTDKMRMNNQYGDQSLPEGINRISKYSPQQNQILDQLLKMGSEGINGYNKYSFDDVRRGEIDRFKNEILPSIQEAYGGIQNSSYFNDALAQAEARQAMQLGQLGYEDQLKQRDFMQKLLDMGLAGRFDLLEQQAPESFGQSVGRNLLSSIFSPEFLGAGANLYMQNRNQGGMGINDFIKGGGALGYLRNRGV